MGAIAAIALGTVALGGASAYMQSQASKKAASTQASVAREGMNLQERQFEATQELQTKQFEASKELQLRQFEATQAAQLKQLEEINALMKPYVDAGYGALTGLEPYAAAGAPAFQRQQALAGTLGPQAQQDAIELINSSPIFRAQITEGENALLQNASATGGLRGGTVQAALAQVRPAMLNAEIERQYGRLGGLTQLGAQTELNVAQLGQAGAARQAAAGLQTAANIGSLGGQMATNIGSFGGQMAANIGNFGAQAATNIGNLGAQAGAAQAGGILGQAGAYGNFLSGAIPQAAGTAFLLNKYNLFGGAQSPTQTGMMIGRSGMEATSPELANNLMFGTPTGFR